MGKWHRLFAILTAVLLTTVACRQLYTTSLGSALARDKLAISSDDSLSDLLDLADANSDTDSSKAILDALAGKNEDDLLSLSLDDQTAILNLATTATVDLKALTSLVSDATADGADINVLITNAFDLFDTSVDLTAVEVLLGNETTLQTAPVESLVLALSTVLADVAQDIGSERLMEILADDTADTSDLTPEQREKIALVENILDVLLTRDTEDTIVAGFDLTDLLKGTQS